MAIWLDTATVEPVENFKRRAGAAKIPLITPRSRAFQKESRGNLVALIGLNAAKASGARYHSVTPANSEDSEVPRLMHRAGEKSKDREN
jgi:hypothetical protein